LSRIEAVLTGGTTDGTLVRLPRPRIDGNVMHVAR
jgi:hypothetical protein